MTAPDTPPPHAPAFSALRVNGLELRVIDEASLPALVEALAPHEDAEEMEEEIRAHYLPRVDAEGRRDRWGFAAWRDGVLVGFSLMGVSDHENRIGYTGADTLAAFRGQGIAPDSKPALFHLAFAMLGLNRLETGCDLSNHASRRSIEKTPGFVAEGTTRESVRHPDGTYEDQYRWAILRRDWLPLYAAVPVEVVP